jgi:hypothetical protein
MGAKRRSSSIWQMPLLALEPTWGNLISKSVSLYIKCKWENCFTALSLNWYKTHGIILGTKLIRVAMLFLFLSCYQVRKEAFKLPEGLMIRSQVTHTSHHLTLHSAGCSFCLFHYACQPGWIVWQSYYKYKNPVILPAKKYNIWTTCLLFNMLINFA